MTGLEKLIDLARITRTIFERIAKNKNEPEDLEGFCYDASCFLWRLAKANGIKVEIGRASCHFFVIYNDMVVDVTATQFGIKEKIFISPLTEAEKINNWWKVIDRYSKGPLLTTLYRIGIYEEEMVKLNEESIGQICDQLGKFDQTC